MKKLIILSAAALSLVACNNRPDYVVLSGKLEGFNGAPIKLVGAGTTKELKLNPDGTFRDTLKIASNYYYITDNMNFKFPLYLEKGDELGVEITPFNPAHPIKFSGRDTVASSYLLKKTDFLMQTDQEYKGIFTEEPAGFKKGITELEKKFNDFLSDTKNLSKSFIKNEKKSNEYRLLLFKSAYPLIHEQITGKKVTLPKEYADEVAKIDYDNADDFNTFGTYQDLVYNNFSQQYDPNATDKLAPLVTYLSKVKSENIKSDLAALLINLISDKNTPEENNKIITTVKKYVKDKDILAQLEARMASMVSFKDGLPLPAFNLVDRDGKMVSSDSFKGKLLYIDLWATWCAPCKKEIPALQKLEAEYQGKNIAFVSISIDEVKKQWDDFLKNNKMTGVQLFANILENPNFIHTYEATSIPRFVLVDKEGKVISTNAPRPSSGQQIKTLIDANL